MPITLEDGSEAYTAEELEAQKQQALEDFKAQNPDKAEELNKMQEELKKKEEEIEKYKGKDLNFSTLRQKLENSEKEKEQIKSSIDEKLERNKKEILEATMKDHLEGELDRLSGGDAELKKKIEFQFKRLGDVAETKSDISKKLIDAFRLASPEGQGVNNSVFSSGGVSTPAKPKEDKLTEDDKDLLIKMGKGHLAK